MLYRKIETGLYHPLKLYIEINDENGMIQISFIYLMRKQTHIFYGHFYLLLETTLVIARSN